MASFRTMIVCLAVVWSGMAMKIQGVPVTVAPTDNLSPYITPDEANKVLLDDFTDLLTLLSSTKDKACNSLKLHCNSITAEDLPAGVTCHQYAEMTGTRHMTCTRTITTPQLHDGIDRTLETTTQELIESIAGHNAMLYGLLALPSYTSSVPCESVSMTSPEYFICRLKTHVRCNTRTHSILKYLLFDLESEIQPDGVSCEANSAVQKNAPLGVLWKIQNDIDTHIKNVRAACEHVKLLQSNPEHPCS